MFLRYYLFAFLIVIFGRLIGYPLEITVFLGFLSMIYGFSISLYKEIREIENNEEDEARVMFSLIVSCFLILSVLTRSCKCSISMYVQFIMDLNTIALSLMLLNFKRRYGSD